MPWQVFKYYDFRGSSAVDKDCSPVDATDELPAEFSTEDEAIEFMMVENPHRLSCHAKTVEVPMSLDEAHEVLIRTPYYLAELGLREIALSQYRHLDKLPIGERRQKVIDAVNTVLGLPRR